MRSRRVMRMMWAAALGGGLWAVAARAQPAVWQGQTLPGLRRVEDGVADVGPLSNSQRLIATDLRVPTGFQGVYQFERSVPFGKPETMFARSSGGLTAVFPRSVYVESRGGLVPEIPAGTVFVIGSRVGDRAAHRVPMSPMAIDMSVAGQPEPAPRAAPQSRAISDAEQMTIWNSERLRQQRIGRILESLVNPAKK